MYRIRHAAIAVGLLASAPASAEFRLSYGHPVHTDAPATSDAAPASSDASLDDPTDQTDAPRFKKALGYGKDIPLAFAVRQIVPHGVIVRYGRNVDANSIVSWRGGRPWPSVLLAAVTPLGLNVRATRHTVLITQ